MAIEFSQHKNILVRIAQMNDRLKEHEFEHSLPIDRYWYIQKAEELCELQSQVNTAAQRVHDLRILLHRESHKVYAKMKADHRIVKNHERKKLKGRGTQIQSQTNKSVNK